MPALENYTGQSPSMSTTYLNVCVCVCVCGWVCAHLHPWVFVFVSPQRYMHGCQHDISKLLEMT